MIVLDTHAPIRWAPGAGEQLTPAAQQAIEQETAGGQIVISSISAGELSVLVAKGRLALSMDVAEWLACAGRIEAVSFVPVDIALGDCR